MKTLEQFNEDRRNYHYHQLNPCLNGIECPVCGAELWDSDPLITLTSNPPQKNIHCEYCDYEGYRIA